MDVILTANRPYKTSAGVRTSFSARIRPNVKVIETAMKQLQKAAILDKTVEKIAYLGGIFSKLRSRPILPYPLPLEAVLLGLQEKAGSLSICRKQL